MLLLDDWPKYDDAKLGALCEVLNNAAIHEFSVIGGNWFKIFTHFDTDEYRRPSGKLARWS